MTQIIEIPNFGGLNLLSDPQDNAGALDMLNVDLDMPGQIRTRDGFQTFVQSVIDTTYVVSDLCPYYGSGPHLIAATAGKHVALNTSGTVVASGEHAVATSVFSLVPWGDTTNQYVIGLTNTASLRYWNGSAWATTAGPHAGLTLGVQPQDNRLVVAGGVSPYTSRVHFSDAGAPFTFGANNYVEITPGDSEGVKAVVAYGTQLVAFKDSKFAVFYGNSTSATGTPVFNYRLVNAGIGLAGARAWCVGPDGIYFLNRRGVFRTTGGVPEPVSRPLDPLFTGQNIPGAYTWSRINWAQVDLARMAFRRGRVYLAVATGSSTTNDRVFVLDPATGQWSPWAINASALSPFTAVTDEDLVFGYSTLTGDVRRLGQSWTTDSGAAISWKYRTGFWTPQVGQARATDGMRYLRTTALDGVGSVTVKTAVSDSTTLGSGQSVTLGTSPAVARGWDVRGVAGRNFGWELSGSGANRVSRMLVEVE